MPGQPTLTRDMSSLCDDIHWQICTMNYIIYHEQSMIQFQIFGCNKQLQNVDSDLTRSIIFNVMLYIIYNLYHYYWYLLKIHTRTSVDHSWHKSMR